MEQHIDDAFAELGLSPGATELEVKAAWRRLVSRWHPDRNDSAAAVAKMQRINRAVEAIRRSGFREPAPSASPADDESRGPGFGDAEAARPGEAEDRASAAGSAAEPPPRKFRRKVRLTLEEAAFGCTKLLRGRFTQDCSACDGTGYRMLGGHCPRCHGSGAIRQRAWFGWVATPVECDACHGGGLARQACAGCSGTGRAATQRYEVAVRFPHGVRDGDLLSVPGRRDRPGSPPSDLDIRVEVRPHTLFELDQDGTLRCAIPVDGFAWIANRAIEVPTLDGLQTIQLHRDQLAYRLRAQGFPAERRGPRGDQLITVSPIFPQRMSTDQQILLDQLIATTSGPDATPTDERLRSWQQTLRAWRRGQRGHR